MTNLIIFYIPFLLCFIIPNLVRLAPWDWDNIKILIYWFVGSLPFVALLLARLFESRRGEEETRGKGRKNLRAKAITSSPLLLFSSSQNMLSRRRVLSFSHLRARWTFGGLFPVKSITEFSIKTR